MPGWLATLIDKLLAKRPSDRFESSAEVADILAQCLAHVQQTSGSGIPGYLRSVATQKHRQPWKAVLAAAAAVVAIGVAWVIYVAVSPRGQQPSADSWPAQTAPESTAAVDWEAAAQEIQSLATDVQALESQSNDLWERDAKAKRQQGMPEVPSEIDNHFRKE
jgi:hypothetical protein